MSEVIPFNPTPVRKPDDITQACRSFLQYKQLRGLAANTIDAYRRDLQQLVGFLQAGDITRLAQVRVQDVDDWVQALLQGEGNSPRTAARKLATVREMLRWAVRRNLVRHNAAEQAAPVRFQSRKVVAPEASTIRRFLDGIDTSTTLGIRDRAMFELMADSALRVSGLACLDLYDPNDPPQCFVGPTGIISYKAKGGQIKETVYTAAGTGRWLDRWLEVRDQLAGRRPCPALFIGERGDRLTRAAIHARIKQWGAAAGLPHIHCHLLRHRRIGDVLQGSDLHLANYLAGHSSKSTTAALYGEQSAERLRQRLRTEVPAGEGATCGS